ncbi:MAG: YbaN family protein [Planctomycetota bacterium]
MAALNLTTPPEASGAWLEEGVVKIRGAGGGAELAGRLLAAEAVRSVVLDHNRDEAAVHLTPAATQPADEALLRDLATLARDQQAALAQTTGRLRAAGEIVCWIDHEGGVDSYFRAPQMATGWKRIAYLAGAALTFGLAVIGAVLPGLPTTPFLLLTSYCLIRSSRRLHDKLLRSRVFGGLLRDWHAHRGVRPGVKTKSLAVMAIVVGATILLSGMPPRAMIGIVACSMIGVVCICRLRVIR